MKRKTLILSGIVLFIALISVTFVVAEYVFKRTITDEVAELGNITDFKKDYISHTYELYEGDISEIDPNTTYYTLEEAYLEVNVNQSTWKENKYYKYENGSYILVKEYKDGTTYYTLSSRYVEKSNPTATDILEGLYFVNEIKHRLDENNSDIGLDNEVISCYASKKSQSANDLDYFYLNQLGVELAFKNSVDTYVRINIQDVWTSRKVYKNGVITNTVILKDSSIYDTLRNDKNWKVDDKAGYVYLKEKVVASDEEKVFNFMFDKNGTFFCQTATASYYESIIVEISFKVDIVQANRAEALWHINNFEEYLKED